MMVSFMSQHRSTEMFSIKRASKFKMLNTAKPKQKHLYISVSQPLDYVFLFSLPLQEKY